MRKGTVPGNWKNLVEDHSEIATQDIFTLAKDWHLNKSSSMPLPREAWQEDLMEPGPPDQPPGSDIQAEPSSITKDTVSEQVIESSTDTPIPSTV